MSRRNLPCGSMALGPGYRSGAPTSLQERCHRPEMSRRACGFGLPARRFAVGLEIGFQFSRGGAEQASEILLSDESGSRQEADLFGERLRHEGRRLIARGNVIAAA